MFDGTENEMAMQQTTFTRRGTDRIMRFAFELARKGSKKHVTSATKSNGISITMPYWDERFREMAARYPGIRADQYHIDILTAHFVSTLVRRRGRLESVQRHLSDLGPACAGHYRHRAVRVHQLRA
jgi:tartrate dehydrogenase/decarboxylase/D-malate dehydrogenase